MPGRKRDVPAAVTGLSGGRDSLTLRSSGTASSGLCPLPGAPQLGHVMQARQVESYINNYVGEWADPYGRRLCIMKVNATTASVSLFAENEPLARPWYESRPSTEMLATYDPAHSPALVVDLWTRDKGFELHLNFEPAYELDKEKRDSLTVALSRFEEDHFLDVYYYLIQPFSHYVKTPGQLGAVCGVR